MEQLLTIKQVSEILGVSKETLRIWDRNDVLPSIKTTGGHRRWKKTDINGYMGSQEEKEIKANEVCIYGRVSSSESWFNEIAGARSGNKPRLAIPLAW